MCGIAGLFDTSSFSTKALLKPEQLLQTRGPDGSGVLLLNHQQERGWTEGSWHKKVPKNHQTEGALLQTRLSIRDLSEAGTQPMSNQAKDVWIVYNGEIYDWEHKADYLRSLGYHFKGHSDTEFILHAYEEWGEGMLPQLQGMFAIAILDLKKQQLLLIRDRLGEKPLFYATHHPRNKAHSLIGFASGVRPLSSLLMQGEKPPLNHEAIDAFLAHRYIPAPLSIVQGISKLPAAHLLRVDLSGTAPRAEEPTCYWQLSPENPLEPTHSLERAIQRRLASDRPVGLFLSGGIDSQAIAASLSRSGHPLPALTASFPQSNIYDEADTAATIAKIWGLPQQTIAMEMEAADLPLLFQAMDEPFGDPSFIPTWYLARAAAQEITVALTGDGGDELFGGYKRYQKHTVNARFLLRHSFAPKKWRSSDLCLKHQKKGKRQRALLGMRLGWQESYSLRFSSYDPLSRAFLEPDFSVKTHYWQLPDPQLPPREWMLACDRLNYLPEYILRKSDLCGMAHGLELRSPFLDHQLLESVLGHQLWRSSGKKSKQWLLDQIGPQAIKTSKHGFNPPLEEWFYQKELQDILQLLPTSLEHLTEGQLSAKRLHQLLQEFFQAHLQHQQNPLNELIWLLVVLSGSLRNLLFYDLV